MLTWDSRPTAAMDVSAMACMMWPGANGQAVAATIVTRETNAPKALVKFALPSTKNGRGTR